MIRAWAVLSIGLLGIQLSRAQEGDQPTAGITLIPYGPVYRSFEEYGHSIGFDVSTWNGDKIRSAEFEIRDKKQNRILRWPYLHDLSHDIDDERPVRMPGRRGSFSEQALRRIGEVTPGDYRVTLYLNGVRSSNVAAVTIDPDFEISKAATFQFRALEPNPFQKFAVPILYVIGPDPTPERFTNLALYSAPIVIDGVERKRNIIVQTGPVGPILPGRRWNLTVDVTQYKPEVDPAKKHVFLFRYGTLESTPFEFDPDDHPLNRDWDEATPRVKDPPPLKPILRGTVTNSEGKPAVGYEVNLVKGANGILKETTNERGEYDFVKAPPGEFSVTVIPPPPAGSPYCSKAGIVLKEGDTAVCDLDFRHRFKFTGQVVDQFGDPVAGISIHASFVDPKNDTEFFGGTKTAEDGTFSMAGPFKEIPYVALADGGKSGVKPRRKVQPDDDITFILPKD